MSEAGIKYSVVIPCYEDASILEQTCGELRRVMRDAHAPYELILVDDGSTDTTFEIAKTLQSVSDPDVVVIQLLRNFGQHAAVCAGFSYARGDVIITIDSDLETPAHEIHKLLEKIESGADVVIGWRQGRKETFLRSIASRCVNWLVARVTNVRLNDYGCMLRAYRRPVIQLIERFPEVTKTLIALIPWLNVRIAEVAVEHRKSLRKRGSRYNFYKLMQMGMDIVTGYTVLPMQMASLLGFFCSFFGFLASAFLMAYRVLYGSGPSGTVTFLALFSLFGGVQLLALGIMGEYVARIYLQVRQRPFYIVKEVLPRNRAPAGGANSLP